MMMKLKNLWEEAIRGIALCGPLGEACYMMRAGCSPALFPPFVFPALDFNELMHYCARPAPQL